MIMKQYVNGEFYEGDFRQLKRNGKGIHYYANGDIYEGDWQNDRRIGKGKITFADNSHLIGQFIEDQADGHGIYQDKDGNNFQSVVANEEEKLGGLATTESGAIRNGKLFEYGKVKYKNDDRYKG